jgi:hypothetical protein
MRRIATIAVIGALGAPGTALAADSGYGAAEGVSGGTPTSSSEKQLPFTGLDVAPMLAAGIVLLGAGFGLSRVGRDRGEGERS